MPPPPYEEILDYILIDANTLQARIAELGREISADFQHDGDLLLVGILTGSVLFLADLMRHITVPHAIDFMDISSYDPGSRSSPGYVRIYKDLDVSIEKRNVLIVEDIIDSGHTLSRVLELLRARHPATLRVCTLLDKFERRQVAIPVDYIGFRIKNVFVFGYGLDIDEYYRNLPFIGVVKPGVVIDINP